MTKTTGRSFGSDFRQFFVRGLVILLPSVLTLWILVQAYRFVDTNVAQPINGVARLVVIRSVPYFIHNPSAYPAWYVITPEELNAERQRRLTNNLPEIKEVEALEEATRRHALKTKWDEWLLLNFIGWIVAFIFFYLAGRIFGGIIGRRIAERFEKLIARIPGFRQIYPHIKQIVDFVFGNRKLEFNRVALVEYPRPGIWSLGLVTGKPPVQWTETAGTDLITLFIPSSPTPFTGYTITVPFDSVTEIDVTVEEAIRFSVSGGVVIPPDRHSELFQQSRAHQPLQNIKNPVIDSKPSPPPDSPPDSPPDHPQGPTQTNTPTPNTSQTKPNADNSDPDSKDQ